MICAHKRSGYLSSLFFEEEKIPMSTLLLPYFFPRATYRSPKLKDAHQDTKSTHLAPQLVTEKDVALQMVGVAACEIMFKGGVRVYLEQVWEGTLALLIAQETLTLVNSTAVPLASCFFFFFLI